jgi:predicted RNase H-like HicB family nuclease
MALTKKTQLEIRRLRAQFPPKVEVSVQRSADGGFVAAVTSMPGVFTQANTLSELLDMVNDAIRCSLKVPQKYGGYMPTYLPPIEMAQALDAYPIQSVERQVTFVLPIRAKADR